MNSSINFNYQHSVGIKKFLEENTKCIYAIAKLKGLLSINCIDSDYMQNLNKQYRNKDYTTDVLTFILDEDHILGDVYLCWDVIKKNAKKYRISLRKELLKVLIHSFVHILGYDHEDDKSYKKMTSKEREIFENIKLCNSAKINWEFVN